MRLKIITTISYLLAITAITNATTRTAKANGSWASAATWSPAGVPAQNDTIIIPSPYKVTSSADIAIGTASGGKLVINSGGNIDMGLHDMSFSHNAKAIINGILSVATLELNGSSSLTNSGTLTAHTSMTLSTSKTFTNSGTLTTPSLTLDDATAFTNTSTGSVTVSNLETNSTSSFTDNGTMTVSSSVNINASSTISVGTGITLHVGCSFNDNSSTELTDNGAILVTGTATFYGGSSISGTGYLTGGEIDNFHNTEVWGVASDYFPCHNCTIPHIGLPIQLMSFTASNTGDAVQLQWATGSETDNNYFTLGRSTDGVNYTTIVTVKGAGNATTEHTYSYTDISAPAGTDYYRLQQTDYDGTITTVGTTVATIAATATTQATVFPNPVRNMCIVSFTDALQENIQVTVYDCTGREAATMNTQTNKGKNAIELNTSALAAGIYFVTIPVSGSTLKARFVK